MVGGVDPELITPMVPEASAPPPTSTTESPEDILERLVLSVRLKIVCPSTRITPSTSIAPINGGSVLFVADAAAKDVKGEVIPHAVTSYQLRASEKPGIELLMLEETSTLLILRRVPVTVNPLPLTCIKNLNEVNGIGAAAVHTLLLMSVSVMLGLQAFVRTPFQAYAFRVEGDASVVEAEKPLT
jgi:hypothetical protein